ncbi:MAG: GtrA family protein [Hyphomonadaceae bacterium]|nr:GtrA family protein [Hyphomonadaceae bacterium]MBX3510092.1 GtrA family protein [Hyphomonadaceae bacterium]
MRAAPDLRRPVVRYTLASAALLAFDFAITFLLHGIAGVSLTLSAAVAFVAAGALSYFVHEFWTFPRDHAALSSRRAVQVFVVLAAAFSGRVGVIAILEAWRAPDAILALIYFAAGVAVSFSINFLANKLWVFR